MLPTILSFVVPPVAAQAAEAPTAPLAMEVSRPQLTRESVLRGASISNISAFGDEDIEYENGEPSFKGNRVFKCFRNRGNGLLFRIVNDDGFKWAFYNDMNDYNMVVSCALGATSHAQPLGKTVQHVNPTTGEKVLVVTVGPRETEMFLDGVPKGFKLSYEAQPIPRAECLARHLKISDFNGLSMNQQGISDDESLPRGSAQKNGAK